VRLEARDATDAAIAKSGTPVVRVDELDERFDAGPRNSKSASATPSISARASLFAFSAMFEIWSGRSDLLAGIRAKISLITRFNSLQGGKKFPVRTRRELARKALIQCPFLAIVGAPRGPKR